MDPKAHCSTRLDFKALTLGAEAVGVGRPVLWGLALYGADGVAAVLEHLKMELENVMRLAGAARLADITPEFIKSIHMRS